MQDLASAILPDSDQKGSRHLLDEPHDLRKDAHKQSRLVRACDLTGAQHERANPGVHQGGHFVRSLSDRFVLRQNDPTVLTGHREPLRIGDPALKLVSDSVDGESPLSQGLRQKDLRQRFIDVERREVRQPALRAGT